MCDTVSALFLARFIQGWRRRRVATQAGGNGWWAVIRIVNGYQASKTIGTQVEHQWHFIAGFVSIANDDLVLAVTSTHKTASKSKRECRQIKVLTYVSCSSSQLPGPGAWKPVQQASPCSPSQTVDAKVTGAPIDSIDKA